LDALERLGFAYATLAANGVRHWATPLISVTDRHKTPIGDVTSRGKQVLDPNDAALVTYALQGVVQYGTGTAAGLGSRPVAGKTGTAQLYVDAWFCGYTPQLATCVWVGYPKNEIPMTSVEGVAPVYGGTIPAAIWHDYMIKALAGTSIEQFPTPSFDGYTVTAPSPAPSPTPSKSPKPSVTVSPSPSESPSPTDSPSQTESPSPTDSPTPVAPRWADADLTAGVRLRRGLGVFRR